MKHKPIFQSIFGDSWEALPPIMKKHYANRPYTDDVTAVEGKLDVTCNQPLKFFTPIIRLLGQVPAYNEKDVPVTVRFESDKDTKSFHFNRTFHFKNTKPYVFKSRMLQIKDNKVVEFMRFGLAWKMLYLWDGEKVTLEHCGYFLNLFRCLIPIPLSVFIGKGYGEEKPVDENSFDMMVSITHPWWGKVYEYKGRFEVVDPA